MDTTTPSVVVFLTYWSIATIVWVYRTLTTHRKIRRRLHATRMKALQGVLRHFMDLTISAFFFANSSMLHSAPTKLPSWRPSCGLSCTALKDPKPHAYPPALLLALAVYGSVCAPWIQGFVAQKVASLTRSFQLSFQMLPDRCRLQSEQQI